MPKKVVQSKNKINIGIAIFTMIVIALPVMITSFTGLSSFQTPYGIYVLSVLGICTYFSCIFGMFAWKNKFLFIIMDIITVIASIGFVVYAYIDSSYQGGLLLHIASALLFTLGLYQIGETYQGDNFYIRYVVPIALDIAGLIFVLWFINVGMSVVAHIVIVSIINFLTLTIFLIPSIVKLFRRGSQVFDDMQNDEVETEEESEEEIAAKQAEKMARIEAKRQEAASKKLQNHPSSKGNKEGDPRRWKIRSGAFDYILRDLTRQFNTIVEYSNMDIRSNNRTIREGYDDESHALARAIQSNKDIKRGIRSMRRRLENWEKNFEKLSNKIFTAKDAYKSFTFDVRKGKLKLTEINTDCANPVIKIKGRTIHSDLVGAFVNEISFDTTEEVAYEIK